MNSALKNTLKQRLKKLLWAAYLVMQPWLRIAMLTVATIWRRLMFRTTFIVVTGSVGKTTAKEAIATVLSAHFPTHKSRGSQNHYDGLLKTILRVRPWHRYVVIEIGVERPGQMKWLAWAARPDIAVWINVAGTHTLSFKTLQDTAKEKSQLIHALHTGALAVLNADNPYIAAFIPPIGIRTIHYGEKQEFDWCVSQPTSAWPERLSFHVQSNEEAATIHTQLVGKHWVPSLLPALIIAREAGLSLAQSAVALASLPPFEQRLSPATCPQGATFLRDEWNGSLATVDAAFEVMREAKVNRRIVVFSGVYDSTTDHRRRYRRFGLQIARVADAAVFIGDNNAHSVKAAIESGMLANQVYGFYNLQDAARHLRTELRQGDLVLLRGLHIEHFSRLYLALFREVSCWLERCPKKTFCDDCSQLSGASLASPSLTQISNQPL